MISLNKENLNYILNGAALLGSGGGGSLAAGKQFIKVILAQEHQVRLIGEDSEETAFVLADIGAVSAFEDDQEQAIYNAFDRLNNHLISEGKSPCKCVFPVETGPENTMAAIVAAAKKGIDVFDGDGAGRAVPQIQLSSYAEAGIKPAPAVISNEEDDSLIVFCNESADMDSLLRPITGAEQFGNSASLALFPATVRELSKGCVNGAISYALHTGRLLKGLIDNDYDLITKALPFVNKKSASLLCSGEVISTTDKVAGAFDIGSVTIKTRNGDLITIYNQNENLLAFSTSQSTPMVVAPHSIGFIKKDMQPITNSEIKQQDTINLLAIESAPELMKPKVIGGFQKLLNSLGYAGKAGVMDSKFKFSPLGDLLKSFQD